MTTTESTPVTLSAKVQKAIDAIKKPFSTYEHHFSVLETSREALATKFMHAFDLWKAEVKDGTFVDFCRVIDPRIPADRDGYRANNAYRAAENLRSLIAREKREGVSPTERAKRIASAPVPPRRAMAQLVAAVVPLLADDTLAVIYDTLRERARWTEGQVSSLRALVEKETPLVTIRPPKGTVIKGTLKLVPVLAQARRAA